MTQILVVDDEQSILELIKNGLRKDGYLITACQTAADVDMQKLHLYDHYPFRCDDAGSGRL